METSRPSRVRRLPGMPPFDQVVSRHGATVLRVCRAVLGPVDADDAWSETFLAALRAYPGLGPETNLEAWLVTVAHRKALDVLRRRGRDPLPTGSLPDLPPGSPPGSPYGSPAGSPAGSPSGLAPEEHDELYAALARLPDKQRLCLAYHHLGGLSFREVAAVVGGTEAAARRASADGMRALRLSLLTPQGADR